MSRFTWHGGGIEAARARFGDDGGTWIDMSTGINPDAWPVPDDLAVDWQRLPGQAALAALEAAAAAHFGIDAAHVCALPGSEVGLRLAGTILPGPAWHLGPSYRTHGEMFGGSAPVARAGWVGTDRGTVILANPNNPDGDILPRERLQAIMARREAQDWLVVDEAFADPDPSVSVTGLVADDRPLLIFRSFGKFFGLAGVRLGFVLGPRTVIERFRKALGAWPVSAAAIAIGTAAYRDSRWIAQARERLHAKALALDILLRRVGHAPLGECPLFRLIETPDAAALFERLGRHAILTRPFEQQTHWLRLGLPGGAEEFARLEHALADG
ncbi:aminotransferase class I/II-fold pyridoxal phosphate-dependent enzyme [Sphingobium sufflavum]|uniref:aminotransferase class I/II-fold pyridoxal phosphate-dependent enzyme n=1 Tax=Sphingobium sufflavum TaxID=1129547 RepID=UPI001F2C4C22|nr:aminotransferase class I/II-fold pyridoxal phosphate-dependent enzyme [Sphingobium sufflavum]MCE7795474.1 aminotransferase class I/II-fold pyridoxal phosphate-dependent enzyme [Sphingobium sufflavum]